MKLLLISNSTAFGEPYLDYPKNEIQIFLGEKAVKALKQLLLVVGIPGNWCECYTIID